MSYKVISFNWALSYSLASKETAAFVLYYLDFGIKCGQVFAWCITDIGERVCKVFFRSSVLCMVIWCCNGRVDAEWFCKGWIAVLWSCKGWLIVWLSCESVVLDMFSHCEVGILTNCSFGACLLYYYIITIVLLLLRSLSYVLATWDMITSFSGVHYKESNWHVLTSLVMYYSEDDFHLLLLGCHLCNTWMMWVATWRAFGFGWAIVDEFVGKHPSVCSEGSTQISAPPLTVTW